MVEVSLSEIYTKMGFNTKPQLVSSRTHLLKRGDTLKHSNGTPIVLYRGESSTGFSDQFKGLGPSGDVHSPNGGVCGGGTYAASSVDPQVNPKGVVDCHAAIRTATCYAGQRGSVVAFSLKEGGKVVQFKSMSDFSEWGALVKRKAEEVTGAKFSDKGCAAAALGFEALRFPVSEGNLTDFQDYWMVFNRGAVVVALDPELPAF